MDASALVPIAGVSAQLEPAPLAVVFRNTGERTVRLLKPLDGSMWGWIMPHYKLTVTDAAGRELELKDRCGLFGHPFSGTTWPDDYVIELEPGGSYRVELTSFHRWPGPGKYQMSFEYIFPNGQQSTPGGDYPEGLAIGLIRAGPVELTLPSTDP